jgi:heparosan-N-sulfate-glucuronate 5-epimerase
MIWQPFADRLEAMRNVEALSLTWRRWDDTHGYWRCRLDVNDGRGPYCLNHEAHMRQFRYFDERGVAVRDYGRGVGRVATPVRVAAYALALWNLHLAEPGEHDQAFMVQAQHLLASMVEDGPLAGGLPYRLVWPSYPLPTPFFSAIGQGYGISVMLRAHELTGQAHFFAAARAMARFLAVSIDDGGTCRWIDGVARFFEEAPTRERPSFILNGHCIALIGLWELYNRLGERWVGDLLDAGVAGLRVSVDRFDVGRWSLYDLYQRRWPNWASVGYHNLHVELVRLAEAQWSCGILRDTRCRWEGGLKDPLARSRASARKILHKALFY